MSNRAQAICDECGASVEVGVDQGRVGMPNAPWTWAQGPVVNGRGSAVQTDDDGKTSFRSDAQYATVCSTECARKWLHKKVDEVTS